MSEDTTTTNLIHQSFQVFKNRIFKNGKDFFRLTFKKQIFRFYINQKICFILEEKYFQTEHYST